jgi:hypothetical protein
MDSKAVGISSRIDTGFHGFSFKFLLLSVRFASVSNSKSLLETPQEPNLKSWRLGDFARGFHFGYGFAALCFTFHVSRFVSI